MAEVRLVLEAGKEMRCDIVRPAKRPNCFDVDFDLASGREGVYGNVFAVRHVEAPVRVPATSCESRLAMHSLGQFDRCRYANGLRLNPQPGHCDLDPVNRYLGHRNSAQQYSMTRRTVFGRKRISNRLSCCF